MNDRRQYRSRYKAEASRNLEDYSVSRCKTILIGALEEFEKGFGFVWGHGQNYNSLTEDQKDMRELWAEVRLEILGRGEMRINQLKDRFTQYTIENKTTHTFKLPREGQDNA